MGMALQAGILAGGVVFVPMALAGWHLTRNRVLFFSAALFIVLAVSVHLLPYFPDMASLVHAIHSPWPYVTVVNSVPPLVNSPLICVLQLHDLVWEDSWARQDSNFSTVLPTNYMRVRPSREFHWSRTGSAAEVCKLQKLKSRDMVDLFRGTWIVIAGDSQLRFFFLSLLDLLMPNASPCRLDRPLQRHSDYEYMWKEENIRLQFLWTPFPANLTKLVTEYRQNLTYPDVLVMGGGLWHMLFQTNSTLYSKSLAKLQRSIFGLFPSPAFSEPQLSARVDSMSRGTLQVPHMFWLTIPTLVNSLLNTAEKRSKMTAELCNRYYEALADSKLAAPGGPVTMIDLKTISHGCGHRCTVDGMHYNNATYEAAVHIMVNALLIATRQSPAT